MSSTTPCTQICPTKTTDLQRGVNTLIAFLTAAFSFWVAAALNDFIKTITETVYRDGTYGDGFDPAMAKEEKAAKKKQRNKILLAKGLYALSALIIGCGIVIGLGYAIQ